jgi:O-antigen ligase
MSYFGTSERAQRGLTWLVGEPGQGISSREWGAFSLLLAFCAAAGVYLDSPIWMMLPGILLFAAWFIADLRGVFFLLLASLPFSVEIMLSSSLGTDLPSEPLMWLLTGAILVRVFWRPKEFRLDHVFDYLLLLHFLWIALTVLFAEIPFIAIKYTLAKGWYILTFYGMGRRFLRTPQDWRRAMWLVIIPLTITHVIVLVRFAGYGFEFADVNRVMWPFYRNHVNFAALAVVLLPYGWYLYVHSPRLSARKWLLGACLLIILVGVQFSYTRAAYGALLGGMMAAMIIRWRLIRPAMVVAVVMASAFVVFVVQENRYLDFAPDYSKTITHYEFSDLLNATYKLQDISTMERVYRWVAGFHMVGERPLTGFGPNNFVDHYPSYAVRSFRTYVSANPERSGIHNYYLMLAVEQGIPGLLIYLLLIFAVMIYGENLYHRTREPLRKGLVLTALTSLTVIHIMQLMNDLIESDKVGPFFFLSMAALVNADLLNRKDAYTDRNASGT